MTLETRENKVHYVAGGGITTFPIPFRVDKAEHIQCWTADSNGQETLMTSGYSVEGLSRGEARLVLDEPIADAHSLTIVRMVPLAQSLSIEDGSAYHASAQMQALDTVYMALQQLDEELRRCLKLGVSSVNAPPLADAAIRQAEGVLADVLELVAQARQEADRSQHYAGQLTGLNVAAYSAPVDSVASAAYNPEQGLLTLGIPRARAIEASLYKVGDGISPWNELPYQILQAGGQASGCECSSAPSSSSVSLDSEHVLATAKAVKTAFDKALEGVDDALKALRLAGESKDDIALAQAAIELHQTAMPAPKPEHEGQILVAAQGRGQWQGFVDQLLFKDDPVNSLQAVRLKDIKTLKDAMNSPQPDIQDTAFKEFASYSETTTITVPQNVDYIKVILRGGKGGDGADGAIPSIFSYSHRPHGTGGRGGAGEIVESVIDTRTSKQLTILTGGNNGLAGGKGAENSAYEEYYDSGGNYSRRIPVPGGNGGAGGTGIRIGLYAASGGGGGGGGAGGGTLTLRGGDGGGMSQAGTPYINATAGSGSNGGNGASFVNGNTDTKPSCTIFYKYNT